MSLGVSIFLSSTILAIIVLFIATKDRWNWVKILLWPLGGLLAMAVAFWGYQTIQNRPRPETEFWGIRLGATKSDVKFLKGVPTQAYDNDQKWAYIFKDSSGQNDQYVYLVQFKGDRVWVVGYISHPTAGSFGPGVHGIYIGDSLEEVVETFGKDYHMETDKDGLRRLFSFEYYRLFFELEKNRVQSYGLYDPELAPKGLRF